MSTDVFLRGLILAPKTMAMYICHINCVLDYLCGQVPKTGKMLCLTLY